MSNTLTGLLPVIYAAINQVGKDLLGITKGASKSLTAGGTIPVTVGKDQTVRAPVVPVQTASDYSPGAYAGAGTDRVISYKDITISKSRVSSFHLTGEERRALMAGGNDNAVITFRDSIAEAGRTLLAEVETDLAGLHKKATRAIGTAATTPFASDLSAASGVIKLLNDQGAGGEGYNLAIDTAAGVKIRNQVTITNASTGGVASQVLSTALLDINLFGLAIRESSKILTSTAGTAASWVTNHTGGYAAGSTTLVVGSGTGDFVEGDIIQIGTGGPLAVVQSWASGTSTITLTDGLVSAVAHAATVTVAAAGVRNLGFHRNAIHLVARPPAIDATPIIIPQMITDPDTGLTFMLCECLQDGMTTYRLHLAWGYAAVNPKYLVILQG